MGFEDYGQKGVPGKRLSKWGTGNYLRNVPAVEVIRYDNFQGGYNAADSNWDVPQGFSPWSENTWTDRKDRIARVPGTVGVHTFEDTDFSPKQLVLHAAPNGRSELVTFDPPNLLVFSEDLDDPLVIDAGLHLVPHPYVSVIYGKDMIFFNGRGHVRKRRFGEATASELPAFPNGATACVFAGRVMVGGAIIDGNFQPMGMRWPTDGTDGEYNFEGETSGAELLLSNDTAVGDRIVATRSINFDYLAILCRKSIWIGRRTEDPFRPADFSQRVTGKGCVNEATARLTYGGVVYLGDEGLEIFDGNQCTHISYAIDDELLPMTSEFAAACSSAYNPVTQLYYLFTPLRTYVYDCLRQRWSRWSMTPLAGALFAEQFHALTWSEAIGEWGDSGFAIWADMAPKEADLPSMYFLGRTPGGDLVLHRETLDSMTMMGAAVHFKWGSPIKEREMNQFLVTHKAIRTRHTGSGSIVLYLPDLDGQPEGVGQVILANSSIPKLQQMPGIHSGLGVGIQVEIVSGDPRIDSIEVDYINRGPRLDLGGFTPREYLADF